MVLALGAKVIVVVEQSAVIAEELRVSRVELCAAELRIVEEEASAEVVDCLLCLRKKLVGDECDVVSRLTEQFWKKGIVAPFTLVANGVEREKVLEDKAREVPWRHHIAEGHKVAAACPCLLPRCRRLVVSVELGMVAVVALTYYQYDVVTAE